MRRNSRRNPILVVCVIAVIFVLGVVGTDEAWSANTKGSGPPLQRELLPEATGLSVPFLSNQGQADETVAFYARTFGGTVFVTKDGGMVYSLPKQHRKGHDATALTPAGWALREELVGGVRPSIAGKDRSVSQVSQFKGKDPGKWRTGILAYNLVSLGDVYEGISFSLKAYGNNVEKLFTVRSGADPSRIGVSVSGAKHLWLNDKGELEAETDLGAVTFSKPLAYQVIDGAKVSVQVAYVLSENREASQVSGAGPRVSGFEFYDAQRETQNAKLVYSFALGPYDRTREVIIDPFLLSTYLGGGGNDYLSALAIDAQGSVYVAGNTYSTDFPVTTGPTYNASTDIFVSRLNSGLSQLLASTYVGGSGDDQVQALALDAAGNVYIGGHTSSTDLPMAGTPYDGSYNGEYDGFVVKLNSTLTSYLASTFVGGGSFDRIERIALHPSGYVYVAGYTASTDFPMTGTPYDNIHNGSNDVFVAKLSDTLSTLHASTFLGGSGDDLCYGLKIDASGDVYVAGNTFSSDFSTTGGAYDTSFNGEQDLFISKLDGSLSQLLASTYLGGSIYDYVKGMVLDDLGYVYVAGTTESTDFPMSGTPYDGSHNGNFDAFVAKLNGALSQLTASTFLGGTNYDGVTALALDGAGHVFVAGTTGSSNFPVTPGAYDEGQNGDDGFISKLDTSLSQLTASTFLGGTLTEDLRAMALSPSGDVYVAGVTSSTDFPVSQGAYQGANNGNQDIFITKLGPSLSPVGLTVVRAGTGQGTVTSSPAGVSCGTTCSDTFDKSVQITLTANPNPGHRFGAWQGCDSTNANQCTVTLSSTKTVTATFSFTFSDALDNPSLVWSTGGDAGWIGQTSVFFYGNNAAESGAITDGQASWIETTVTGPATVRFYWKVSSEESGDFLKYYVNGVETSAISGEVGWQQMVFTVPAGLQTLRWEYGKNGSGAGGSDRAWLDKVEVLATLTVSKPGTGLGTVVSSPAGISCGSTCSTLVTSGSTIVLTATVGLDSLFTGWSGGGCSGTGACSTTIITDTVITATFTKKFQPGVAAIDELGHIYAAASNGDGTWSGYTNLGVDIGDSCRAVSLGDFDSDGYLDIVAGCVSSSKANYYFFSNNIDGTFTNRGVIFVLNNAGSHAMDIAAGDFNNDGKLDLVVSGNSVEMALLLGNGDGTFTFGTDIPALASGRGIDTADFNHDGKLDFLRGIYSSGQIYLYLGDGAGNFTSTLVAALGTDPYGVVAGDFDNDGHPDFIANSGAAGDPYFFKGNGDGTFLKRPLMISSLDFNDYGGFDAYDFNNDGKLDVVAVNESGKDILYYPGNGDGTFGAAAQINTSDAATSVWSVSAPPSSTPFGTPVAAADLNSTSIAQGGSVTFDGSGSTDPNGSIALYLWNFENNFPLYQLNADGYPTTQLFVGTWGSGSPYCSNITSHQAGTETLEPSPGDVLNTNTWFEASDADGNFDWNGLFGTTNSYGYSLVYLYSPTDQSVRMKFGSNDAARIWLNQTQVYTKTTCEVVTVDEYEVPLDLVTGWNRLLVRISHDTGTWGLAYRITDTGGIPLRLVYATRKPTGITGNSFSTVVNPSHSYATEGVYRGYLKVTDNSGLMAYDYFNVTVQGSAPTVNAGGPYTFNESFLQNGVWNVTLTGSAGDTEGPVTYGWNFGDTYQTNFSGGNDSLWEKAEGTWVLGAGVYSQTNAIPDRTRNLVTGVHPFGDFTMEADALMTSGTGQEVQLLFRARDIYNNYEFIFRGRGYNDVLLYRRVKDGTTPLAETDLPFTIVNNKTYRLRVVCQGSNIKGYVDGDLVIDVTDSTFLEGYVGFSTYQTAAVFDNLAVTSLSSNVLTATHKYYTPGVYTVSLTATDGAGQVNTSVTTMTLTSGNPPVASIGGPYSAGEAQATAGRWAVPLNGCASSDDFGILDYTWVVEQDGFNGSTLGTNWIASTGVTVNSGVVTITGATGWGTRFLFNSHKVTRNQGGATFQARVRASSGSDVMFGFKNPSSASYSYTAMPYAIYFIGDARVGIHEDGSDRGASGYRWVADRWYDLRIELKETQGARYYYRETGETEWILLYDSTYGTATEFMPGVAVYDGNTTVDWMGTILHGSTPTAYYYTAGSYPLELTVTDQALQSSAVTTTVTISVGNPPVAVPGGPYSAGEAQATAGRWVVALDGSASTDDAGIASYLWTVEQDDFSETAINGRWLASTSVVQQTGVITITGSTWGTRYLFNKHLLYRDQGNLAIQTTVKGATSNNFMFGFKNTGTNYSYTQMPYAIYFVSGGAIQVYEDNSPRGDTAFRWNVNTWYDLKIELKPTAGARYYFRQTGSSDWILIYDSTYGTATEFLSGFVVSANNTTVTDYKLVLGSAQATASYYGTGAYPATLTVTDNAGLTNTAAVTVTVNQGAPPVAEAGSGVTLGEANAVNGTWTVQFNGSGSADDSGRIYSYNWNFGDGAAGTGVNPTHTYLATGVYTVTLTVTDHAFQVSQTDSLTVTIQGGAPPVANAGGPYMIDEATLTSSGKALVAFNATGSTDDTGIYRYYWDFGTETFDGIYFNKPMWDYSPGVRQEGYVEIRPNTSWGGRYLFTSDVISKTPGLSVEAQVMILDAGETMFGFKNTSTNYSYTQMPYAIYLYSKSIYVYEDGTSKGDTGFDYEYNTWYDLRIQIRDDGGADYFYRRANVGDPWTLVYRSTYTTPAGPFKRGVSVYSSTCRIDNFRFTAVGSSVTMPIYKEGSATLTVEDHAHQTQSQVVAIDVQGSSPPTANHGGPYVSTFELPTTFNGSDSTDDNGIVKYLWDFGDGTQGSGARPVHTYAIGTYTQTTTLNVSLTVVDAGGQSDTKNTTITLSPGPLVICVPWHISGGVEVPHDTWAANEALLKCTVKGGVGTLKYTWNYGDGTAPSAEATVSNKFAIQGKHTYTGAAGTPYVATCTVRDSLGRSHSDTYPITVRDKTLDTEINVAIDDGLWYVHQQQERDGGTYDGTWVFSTYYASPTAAAVHALQINGHLEVGDPRENPYVETVQRGLKGLLKKIRWAVIGTQTAGNPDTNGNGIGIETESSNEVYEGGMVMDALGTTSTPDRVVLYGDVNVANRTYKDILTDMVDMYAWGQADTTNPGGWRYDWNVADADNSVSQWAAIGLMAAKDSFAIETPAFVKSQNLLWLTYSQNAGGYFGYTTGSDSQDYYRATTPSGLVQLAFCEVPTSDTRWIKAENWIADRWTVYSGAHPYIETNINAGNRYYAWFAIAKAMRTAKPAPVALMRKTDGTTIDWFNDPVNGMARAIITDQHSATRTNCGTGGYNGCIPGADQVYGAFRTAWGVTILTSSLFFRPPVADLGGDTYWGAGIPLTFDASDSYHLNPERHIVLYEWDFNGDGTYDYSSTSPTATFTYTNIMTYTVTLRITDDGNPPQSDTASITVRVVEPPHAPFAVPGGPYRATLGIPITLDGSGSFDIDPTDFITAYAWDLDGDGVWQYTSATGITTTHVFTATGVINIGLKVTDNGAFCTPSTCPDGKLSGTDFTTVTVTTNNAPVANAGGPYVINEGQAFIFDGSGSLDPDNNPITYSWNFGGNANCVSTTVVTPTCTFPDHGVYTVSLTVSDTLLQNTGTVTVTVRDLAPFAVITGTQVIDTMFTASYDASGSTSAPDPIVSYEWDWNYNGATFSPSGDTSALQTHVFTTPGTYTVAVRVTDDDGSSTVAFMTTIAKAFPAVSVLKAGRGSGTVSSNPAGIGCGGDCSEPFVKGTVITLTAVPVDNRSVFAGWSGGGCSGTGTCTVTANNDVTVTASFDKAGKVYALTPGWNFISTPVDPENPNLDVILQGIGTHVWIVWGYNNETKTWVRYWGQGSGIQGQNTLTFMEAGKGYWFYVDEQVTLYVDGLPSGLTSITLYGGWNLVGPLGADNRPVLAALDSIGESWSVIWNYMGGQWFGRHPTLSPLPGYAEIDYINLARAYWLRVREGGANWPQ
jgi:PKD repeat protein